jgi:predicted Abi (CAAX) family protease
MLKERGIFKRTTAYLGLAAGVLGFISVGRLFIAVILHTVLITIWFLFVGYRLCRLGWDHSDLNLALRSASQAVD